MTVALVAAAFVMAPAVRADDTSMQDDAPQGPAGQELVVIKGANSPSPQQPFASSNDTCAGADAIAAGPFPVLSTIQNIGANTDAGDPPTPTCAAAGNAAQGAAWWSFTPTTSNTYIFNTCSAGTTHDDTIVAVYSSSDNTCGGTLTQVGCSDDDNSCPGVPFLSRALANLVAGNTYYVVVWNWAVPPATADVQIEVSVPPPPANDLCEGAVNLPLNSTVRGTLLASFNDYSLSDGSCFAGVGDNALGLCDGSAGRDVAYSFTAPANGAYSIRVRNEQTSANLMLFTTTSCPAPGVIACPAGAVASNKNLFNSAFNTREEVSCQPMVAGQTIYAFVDGCSSPPAGGTFNIEAAPCFEEGEPNDTTASASGAPYAGISPIKGSIGSPTDVDFFSLGTPPANSRVFASLDANSASSAAVPPNPPGTDGGDFDLRVTTDTDTLEYDQNDMDTEHGGESGGIAGRVLTGVPTYLRVNNRLSTTAGEPYLLYSVIQPPGFDQYGSSASVETNEGTNGDFPGAETAGNLYWAGTLFNSTDIDFFRICAAQGDMIHIQADSDPTRTDALTPPLFLPGKVLVTAFSAVTGGQLGPFSGNNPAAAQVADYTPSPATLTGTTPFSPSETYLWRAEYDGPHFGYIDMRGTVIANQDYLFSVAVNGQTGSEMSSDIQITKTGPETAAAGEVVVYDITLTNNGPSIATNAQFFDQLPDGTAFAGFGLDGVDDLFGACNAPPLGDVGGSVDCTFECLPAGRTVTIQIAVQVFQCIGEGFQLFNQVFAGTVTTMTPESVTFATFTTNITDDGSCEADGDACTIDSCTDGVCTVGGPPNCDDSNPCTDDACDEEAGCVSVPNTNSCDDGNACTSGDVCGDGACVPGGAVDPDDSNACTDDSCDPGTGVHNDPNTNPCDDGNACTVGDTCGGGSCQAGGPLPCDDGNVCTDDGCSAGVCVYGFNTNTCDDGDPGTIDDVCSSGVCAGVDACDPTGARPKSKGYYHSLCNSPHSGDELTADDAACVAGLSSTFADVTSVADICAVLHTTGSDKCLKAEEDLMATALNICKQKFCPDQAIDSSCGSFDTVGASFDAADAALSDPGRTTATCDAADCQAKELNNGGALNLTSLAISHVAGEIRLDWEPPLLEVPPSGYKVWRRAVGSMAPFTQIGTTPTPHFVDPTGLAGNFEYEIQAY